MRRRMALRLYILNPSRLFGNILYAVRVVQRLRDLTPRLWYE